MSARYVWNKCDITPPPLEFKTDVSSRELGVESSVGGSYGVYPLLCKNATIGIPNASKSDARFYPVGDYIALTSGYYSCAEYPYVIIRWNNNYDYGDICAHGTSGYWSITGNSTTYTRLYKSTAKNTTSRVNFETMYSPSVSDFTKGPVIERVSSNSSSKYKEGIDGNFWYEYIGSDNIDPYSIAVESEEIRPGDSISISVSPNSSTYGGTISYLYQYSLNGGAWTDITTTTETSVNFTVPANAKTIQFRARAQDNMGFTSTTYVTGALIAVELLNAWIGINGKARKCTEMYVGVNGKARKVVGAWIGVNGKARRFL